jgi:sec-independent protein translocase protein TatB
MPSFQDSAVIFFIALLLFGPKKLPELARQLGKLMGEFRRASNEFRMQMEDELRIADQQEQQKKIAAMEAAAPVPPAITEASESTIAETTVAENTIAAPADYPVADYPVEDHSPMPSPASEPLPIATSGELNLMPPSTGLPVSNSTLTPVLDSIPHTSAPHEEAAPTANPEPIPTTEASLHG